VQHELQTYEDDQSVARAAAAYVAQYAHDRVSTGIICSLAMSGGRTPAAMFRVLGSAAFPWESAIFYQVDERIAPANDPARNVLELRAGLGDQAHIRAMPVDDDDLDAAANHYASLLPEEFDLVHLGLGPDGHTASLVPGDPVLDVVDRRVALTNEYQGHRRMTLTYEELNSARQLLWVVTGAEKKDALARLLDGDSSIPAGRVVASRSIIMADRAAL